MSHHATAEAGYTRRLLYNYRVTIESILNDIDREISRLQQARSLLAGATTRNPKTRCKEVSAEETRSAPRRAQKLPLRRRSAGL